ncbi:unnamed protein product [Colias eurytheme]|nr:unnamed protein product [Colias eurytheme]
MNLNTDENTQLTDRESPIEAKVEEPKEQETKSVVTNIGDGTDMQSSKLTVEPRASSSKTNRKSIRRRRKYEASRSIIPRSSKTKAKNLIHNIARGIKVRGEAQLRILHSTSMRRKAAKSEAMLRRRLRMTRSSESFGTSGKCPRCGHASCNWYPNNKKF